MAIARCKDCGQPNGKAQPYELAVHPVGYPNTASICGRKGCESPAFIWLGNRYDGKEKEKDDYETGVRIFGLKTDSIKVKVSDSVEYRQKND